MKVTYISGNAVVRVQRGAGYDEPVTVADVEGAVLITGLLWGEPIFALRARDARTFPVLTNYAGRVVSLFSLVRGSKLLEDLFVWAKWQRDHADIVRDPD